MKRFISIPALLTAGLLPVFLIITGCSSAPPASQRDLTASNYAEVEQGIKLYKEGKYDDAIKYFDLAIKKHHHDANAMVWRGSAYFSKGLYDLAIADYTRAIKEDPEYPEAYLWRGYAYYSKALYKLAIADFTRAIEQDPRQIRAFGWRGTSYYHEGQYKEALADFDPYLSANPNDPWVIWFQGSAFLKIGAPDRARANVTRLIEIDPRLATNFSGGKAFDLYDLEKRRKTVKQAVDAAEQAEASGNFQEAFNQYNLALSWYTNRTDEDIATTKKVDAALFRLYPKLTDKPTLPETARRFNELALRYMKEKNYSRAVDYYGKVQSIAPWWPQARFNTAIAFGEQKKFADAISQMKRYLELAPESPDAQDARDNIRRWEARQK
ncbi:MAG TPA: tetratricopeptide repeat protein [Burkholderiales bacterium]|nr:tetratricopeptide repeat protein [Burkholderiales bacterium]